MGEPFVLRLLRAELHEFTLHQVGDDLQCVAEFALVVEIRRSPHVLRYSVLFYVVLRHLSTSPRIFYLV